MATTPGTPTPPSLPSATDGSAIASYIVSLVTALMGFLAMFHIGLPGDTPAVVQQIVTYLGFIVAAATQWFNQFTHRQAHKAAVLNGIQLAGDKYVSSHL